MQNRPKRHPRPSCSTDADCDTYRCPFTPRYIDHGNGTVTDRQTGLMWEQKTNDASIHDISNTYTWTISGDPWPMDGSVLTVFLNGLNDTAGGGAACFAGHCDWRLPSEDGYNPPGMGGHELAGILRWPEYPCLPGPCLDSAFGTPPNANPQYSWSRTAMFDNPFYVYVVDLYGGDRSFIYADAAGFGHARAVRGP